MLRLWYLLIKTDSARFPPERLCLTWRYFCPPLSSPPQQIQKYKTTNGRYSLVRVPNLPLWAFMLVGEPKPKWIVLWNPSSAGEQGVAWAVLNYQGCQLSPKIVIISAYIIIIFVINTSNGWICEMRRIMTEMVMVMSLKNKYGRDVRGGLFSCGAGRGGTGPWWKSAGLARAKKHINQLIPKILQKRVNEKYNITYYNINYNINHNIITLAENHYCFRNRATLTIWNIFTY